MNIIQVALAWINVAGIVFCIISCVIIYAKEIKGVYDGHACFLWEYGQPPPHQSSHALWIIAINEWMQEPKSLNLFIRIE